MAPENVVVAVCQGVADADAAVAELRQQGVDAGCISMVTPDAQSGSTPVAYYLDGAFPRRAPAQGGCLPQAEALPVCAVLVSPGERTAFLAGPFAGAVVRILDNQGLFGDLGPIAGGLYSLGISRDAARDYELTALQGRALVIVHGPARDVARARCMLAAWIPAEAATGPLDPGGN